MVSHGLGCCYYQREYRWRYVNVVRFLSSKGIGDELTRIEPLVLDSFLVFQDKENDKV